MSLQDLALALTGASTCTLIAFVFPALLFVQAAKEAQGKSDAPVRAYQHIKESDISYTSAACCLC